MPDLQSELTRWTEFQRVLNLTLQVPYPENDIIAAQLAEEELEYEAFLTEAYYGEDNV